MNYQIKHPFGLDISHWEPEIQWARLFPKPVLVITKASDGKAFKDPLLKSHWAGMTSIGVPRGLYHFFQANDVAGQIANYLSQCQLVDAWDGRTWKAEIPPILDMEYTPGPWLPPHKRPKGWTDPPRGTALANQIKVWLDGVQNATGVRPIIYSRATGWAYVLDALGRAPAWTKDYQAWVAGYPNNPDLHAAMPDAYLPKGFLPENVVMWQYAEDGIITGVPFDGVDLNLVNPLWLSELGVPIPPPEPDPVPVPPGSSPFDVLKTYELETLRNGEVKITEVS